METDFGGRGPPHLGATDGSTVTVNGDERSSSLNIGFSDNNTQAQVKVTGSRNCS